MILRELPERPREALYAGAVCLLPPTEASQALAATARGLLEAELGPGDVRETSARLSNDELFGRMGRVRKILYTAPRHHDAVREVVAAWGFEPEQIAFDPVRLRVVTHRGHENPLAAPVYTPHRDVWYGHPHTLITWWIPLFDLPEAETFVFYPDWFERALPNDSEVFDYDEWVAQGWSLKIGWQDIEAGKRARYPGLIGAVDRGRAQGFSCRAGENLLFSGAHFHATLPHHAGRTRFSLDFRIVHLGDRALGRGAPNVDNRSRGSALGDYVQPG